MPPESLPLDRKDFFKERKHERSEFAGPSSRWRDSSNHGSREFNRWGSGDFRRPSGHGRQGGWQLFSDEYGHGYVPSMSFGNKIVDNASSRSSAPHGDGKYARNGRENRSFSQRDWKGHSWSTSNGSNNNCGRLQHDLNYDQRSVHEMMIYPSHSHPDFVNSRDKVKGQHDKISDANVLGTNHRRDREYSLSSSGWKPLKWTRSGGLSSRSSISGHSSSTKSFNALNSEEAKSEIAMKNVTQDMSPSADPAEWEMSAPPSDETTIRKKPRLGWGEGLAKYEKKKVEAPDSAGFSNAIAESTHSLSSSLVERGPRGSGFSDCTSPATPSSVVYGSSPDGDDKLTGKAANIDNDVSNLHGSPGSGFQSQYEGPSSNLEKSDNFPIANLESPLNQQLQSNDDSNSADSCFMSSTEMNKLLIYKNEISKVLETTESEIDLLENELKGLRSENKGCFSYPSVARALLVEDKYIEEHKDASSSIPQPSVPEVDTSGESVSEKLAICLGDSKELHSDIKGKDIDMSGRYGAMDSINVREMPSISSYNAEDNIVSSVDSGILVENEAFTKASISNDVHEHSDKGYNVFDLILASNKESAYRAAEALNSLLPANEQKVDIWSSNASGPTNQLLIEERFAQRRHLLRFKERAITLKFRAFQSFWKENSHVPPVRKLRSKSQKKSQSSLGPNQSGYQKNRSSVRFHLPPSAGNLNPVPTAEILKHMGKQLSNSSQVTLDRKTLKMPALILDPKDKMASRFSSKNGLVEDPFAVEKERMMINPWTAEEKDVFLDKLASFGKDFKKISSFLNHKTTADCVEFYYKNHKSDCFKKTKKLEFGKKIKSSTSAYMVTAEKKWNLEMNTASLDMLGAASVMTARAYKNVGNQHKYSSRMGGRTEHRTTQIDDCLSEKAECSDILGNEREQVAADVLAGICGSMSSEAMGSCITNNLDRRERSRELKCKKGSATVLRWRMKAKVPQNVDDEICSGESCGEMESPYWTDGERSLFMEAVTAYGKNFSMISSYVRTKSTDQCKVFFSKARKCLGLDLICSGNKKAPGNNENANRGSDVGSGDTKEACMLASNPIPSSEGGCQMVEDFPKFVSSINGESDPLKTVNTQTTHQELQEHIPSSKISHSDAAVAAVDSLVSDACSREDSPCLASDKKDLLHNQKPAAVCMNVENTEQGSSAPVAASVENTAIVYSRPRLDVFPATKGSDDVTTGKQERRNVDASDQNDVLLHTSKSSRVNLLPQDEQRYPVRLSLSDSERSYRNGDVKLFGQILTHPSVQKSKSGSDENGVRTKLQLHRKFKRRLKINHGDLVTAKLDLNSTPDKEDVPSRTYRNGIQSGLSSLPDPAHLRAQYPPAAFDHSSTTTSGNQQLQPIGNDQESKVNPQIFEVSCSSGRLTDHDKELSSQRNNVSELISALQQQDKQTNGGIIVGDSE